MAASRLPLVVVLGATGAGKSNLAIEIAKVFNGEIISADSMQIYKGLDIISNKVTEEEQRECPHHMISYLEAASCHNTVVDFRNKALPIIDSIFQRDRMPVVVGGTNYYIESLLWYFLVKTQTSKEEKWPVGVRGDESPRNTPSALQVDSVVSSCSDLPQNPQADSKKRRLDHTTDKKEDSFVTSTTEADQSNAGDDYSTNVSNNSTREILSSVEFSTSDNDNDKPPSHPSPSRSEIHRDVHKSVVSTTVTTTTTASDIGTGSDNDDDGVNEMVQEESEALIWLNSFTTPDLYSKLMEVDPDTALRHHPNNRRKLLRALQVFYDSGTTLSSILALQHGGQDGGHLKSGPLRYPDPCILWVKCEQPNLNQRLDNRVDSMIERGLLRELEDFDVEARRLQQPGRNETGNGGESPTSVQEFPHGIMQMIGFKEFRDFLQLSSDDRLTENGQKLFQKGVQDLKQVTRRYARQQIRWINNRFCSRPGPDVPPVYAVDSTHLDKWPASVKQAIEVVKAYTKGEKPSQSPEPTTDRDKFKYERHECDVCDGRVFLHQHEWQGHIRSKKHKHNVKLSKKRAELSSILKCREEQLAAIQQDDANSASDEELNDDDSSNNDDDGNNDEFKLKLLE